MSTFEHIALQQSPRYGLSDPLTVGLPRQVNGTIAHLRSELWIVRLAVCCGFAGAVLVQVGVLSLFAQLALMLDTSVLPSIDASFYCLLLGAIMMLTSRPLSAPRTTASLG
jgi:uncharacterized membrane protein YfcA